MKNSIFQRLKMAYREFKISAYSLPNTNYRMQYYDDEINRIKHNCPNKCVPRVEACNKCPK